MPRKKKVATNWPPASGTYPSWPPVELGVSWVSFSSVQVGIDVLRELGFTRANPTAQENQAFFRNVRCDHGDQTNGIMIVSPLGVRYPFAYCVGANHKAALVLWIVGYDNLGQPCYDLGYWSGNIV